MGAFVLDASAAIAWASPDEYPPQALAQAMEAGDARVPSLWLYEVHNVLHVLRRRGRLSGKAWGASTAALAALPLEVESPTREIVESRVVATARTCNLTVYDAAYLELAMRSRLPLATLDDALREAAGKADVELLP